MDTTDRLVWMDLEMTGLDPVRDRILEIATLVTDGELEVVAEGPDLVIRQPKSVLDAMDDWNRQHHGESGLIERALASAVDEREAEAQILEFLREHTAPGAAPLAGNSVHQDRRFLERHMAGLVAHLHYRIVDVSTLKELVRRWYPDVFAQAPPKHERHRALEDIRESIQELRYYRRSVFRAR